MDKVMRDIIIKAIVILLIIAGLLWANNAKAEICEVLVTKDMYSILVQDTDVDGNPANVRPYLLYKRDVKKGARFGINSSYGDVNLHYQERDVSGRYGEFHKSCDGNTIRIP